MYIYIYICVYMCIYSWVLRTTAALQSVIESWIVGETLVGRKVRAGNRRQHTVLQVSCKIVIIAPKIALREHCAGKKYVQEIYFLQNCAQLRQKIALRVSKRAVLRVLHNPLWRFHVLRTYRRAARDVDECGIGIASFVQQFKRKTETNHSEVDVARTIASIPCWNRKINPLRA